MLELLLLASVCIKLLPRTSLLESEINALCGGCRIVPLSVEAKFGGGVGLRCVNDEPVKPMRELNWGKEKVSRRIDPSRWCISGI
ncbi:hypothetical protein SCP_0201400 [Sparassis crispa]|uniref:Uncharacterized protein n=1 Tax=Sparassis crispa TaxID=139825 RepID=A0A401G9Y5_9APHY|nr:hypothetical protein SCP_0201400 [Sparassis crispa]GBE78943.1 hypothetical protein SCP_0201400 [Sparassis crispa]